MAEFALGLTKTAVEGTVSRVKSAIDEEEKLKVRVQNDLVFITGEFQMMQSFLNVANKERAKNEVVRTWVRQIRDLAFDVEDCVELVVSLDVKSGWSWLWRVLPGCMAPPRPLDQAVAEIQRLKARVEDVSHRNTRYNLINDSGSDSKTTAQVSPELLPNGDIPSSPFHILREVWEAAGKIRHDMRDLRKLLNNEGRDREVISLWGGQGSDADLGTMHVLREAYNDPVIGQEFKSQAWIKLIRPFNPDEFLKSLLTQFYASSHRAKVLGGDFRRKMKAVKAAVGREDDLTKAQLMQQVSDEQRYLVIVEQLSTVAEWNTIRMYLPDSKNGSRIVVTTKHLGLALSCTGNPYQVSELRQFSYGQSLCALFSKVSGRRTDMGELIWQIRRGGVISVWGCPRNPKLLDAVYTGITHKLKVSEGVEFERHNWVDVPHPFDLGVFSRHLFFNFHSDDLRAKEILAAGIMGDTGVIHGCRKFLRGDHCLVVINGLKSTDDWNLIKSSYLSYLSDSEPTKCCILVTTTEESVAKYCVDEENRALDFDDLDADTVLRHSVKSCEYYGSEGRGASSRGHFFSNRRQEARDWIKKFRFVTDPCGQHSLKLRSCLQDLGLISLCGLTGAWKSALAREIYYEQMLIASEDDMLPKCDINGIEIFDSGFTKYSWVNVPHPFNLMDFSWRLFLDFHSDDLKAKQAAAFNMMEGRQDPIEGCLKFLHQEKCFVVIDGLRSSDDWDLIKDALSAQRTKGCILVITDEKSVATHCVQEEDRVVFTDGEDLKVASNPLVKNKGYSDQDMSHIFSSRMIEARGWKKFKLIGRGHECFEIFRHRRWNVSSVWGIAGVGKSALVKGMYFDDMIGTYLHQTATYYSWVDVPHAFNLIDLSRRLLVDFHSVDLEAKEIVAVGIMEGQDPIQMCRNFLQESRCFVVIDGLRSIHDWDLIKTSFLSDPIKGRIIVITNNESVATHCVDKQDCVVNIKGLEAHATHNLYTKIAWNGKQLDSEYVELSRLIMTKCGGLPKVIVAIGEYHRTTYPFLNQKDMKRSLLESTNVDFMSLLETDPAFHCLRGLFSWMQSYFDDCQDYLKPCIFYLSVFPFGDDIRRRRLLRRWIAEGYCRDTSLSTAEENGEKFFSELVKLSIIQQQEKEELPSTLPLRSFSHRHKDG